jgi:uncharacterized membrane protein HdeD (DUF308 family)
MEGEHPLRSKDMWILVGILLLIAGVAVTLILPEMSTTTKLFLLGAGLILAGVLGRKKLKQG